MKMQFTCIFSFSFEISFTYSLNDSFSNTMVALCSGL